MAYVKRLWYWLRYHVFKCSCDLCGSAGRVYFDEGITDICPKCLGWVRKSSGERKEEGA